jgi:hypothetical protein
MRRGRLRFGKEVEYSRGRVAWAMRFRDFVVSHEPAISTALDMLKQMAYVMELSPARYLGVIWGEKSLVLWWIGYIALSQQHYRDIDKHEYEDFE